MSFILQNIIQIMYGPSPINTPQVIPPTARVDIGGVSIGWINIFVIVIAVVLMVGLQLFVSPDQDRAGRCAPRPRIARPPR